MDGEKGAGRPIAQKIEEQNLDNTEVLLFLCSYWIFGFFFAFGAGSSGYIA